MECNDGWIRPIRPWDDEQEKQFVQLILGLGQLPPIFPSELPLRPRQADRPQRRNRKPRRRRAGSTAQAARVCTSMGFNGETFRLRFEMLQIPLLLPPLFQRGEVHRSTSVFGSNRETPKAVCFKMFQASLGPSRSLNFVVSCRHVWFQRAILPHPSKTFSTPNLKVL